VQRGQRHNWGVQALVVLAAVGLTGLAVALDDAWLERHILPEFFQPRDEQLRLLEGLRAALLLLAVLLLWPIRPWLARHRFVDMLPTLVAIALAFGTAEVLLRVLPWYSIHQLPAQREPQRERDPLLGWRYRPDRVGRGDLGGRIIDYAFDAAGHRVARRGEAVDYAQPSVLFLGESIVGGHGVTYDETIPARVGARLSLQPANLAVGGYATDQMYLRFRQEWPQYRQPKAVVVLFMPLLFHRNLEHDRPHLEPGLVWRPPSDDLRLAQIVRRLVPARSQSEIDAAGVMTRQALAGIVAAARAKGAVPLVLVPQLTQETAEEAAIRARVLAGLPHILVPVDPTWRVPNNRHPDARANAALADAVARYLETRLVHDPAPKPRPAG
jgi:hypothetical protein